MSEKITYSYYTSALASQNAFFRLPRALYEKECFRGLSNDAKTLYALMLDRMSLALANQWLDEDGKVYINYSLEDIMTMYTCISGETGAPVANRFQIASKITPTSYVSHHTAMEYYGITDQVYYDVYVASETSFREFEFDGYTYRYVASKDMEGVETPALSGGIRITNRERTLVDCVKDMDKIAGIEEVIQDIGSMKRMQEKRVLAL